MTDSLKCEAHGMNYVIHGRFARDVSVAQELQAVGFSLSEEVNCKNISSFLIPLQPVLKGQFPPKIKNASPVVPFIMDCLGGSRGLISVCLSSQM